MYKYRIIDAHCDSASEMYGGFNMLESRGHLDLKRMRMYKHWTQFFAVFIEPELDEEAAWERTKAIIVSIKEEVQKNSDIVSVVKNAKDIEMAEKEGKCGAFISVEGASGVGESLNRLDCLYQMGVRCIAPVWNKTNLIAAGAEEENPDLGLTDFGKRFIKRMNEIGIITDVSHMSEKSFWDTAEIVSGPFIASHSNSKAVCSHRRNLTDKQFLALKKSGGVAGINYYSLFLKDGKTAATDDIIKHIEHFASLGGIENIGLGSDFDGVDVLPHDLPGAEKVYTILDRLASLNYTEEEINMIAYDNFHRIITNIC